MSPEIDIRPATSDDAAFLAWVMLAAGRSHVERGLWDVLVGDEDRCLEFLERLVQTDTRSYCHHSAFFVLDVDGRPASGMCGYDPDVAGLPVVVQSLKEAFDAFGWDADAVAAAEKRAAPMMTCASEEPSGSWIIECVATVPELRGRGLVRRLLEYMLEQGRRLGFERAQISVLIDNTAAERAYQGVGFEVVDEKRHPDFEATFGCPGVRRLVREL